MKQSLMDDDSSYSQQNSARKVNKSSESVEEESKVGELTVSFETDECYNL